MKECTKYKHISYKNIQLAVKDIKFQEKWISNIVFPMKKNHNKTARTMKINQ